jgi:hypothetical protein
MYVKGKILWLKVNHSYDKSHTSKRNVRHKLEGYGEVEWFVWILLLTWLVVYGEQINSSAVLMKVLLSFTVATILDFKLINRTQIYHTTM